MKMTISDILKRQASGEVLQKEDIERLLEEVNSEELELMAKQAQSLSLSHFGKSVGLYTPLYLSNYCINGCRYCNYGLEQDIKRRALSEEEIVLEAKVISEQGLRHVLLLTGESETDFSFEKLLRAVKLVQPFFDAVSVESYAMTQSQYTQLAEAGVLGITLYQETYNRKRYEFLHPYGPKSDYHFRKDVPYRVGASGIRQLTMGILLGLSDLKEDLLSLIEEAKSVEKRYPHLEMGLSLPRMIAFEGSQFDLLGIRNISDRAFIQALCTLRIALPHFSIGLSTRESRDMRKNTLPIGINKMSAGVSTEVGGHLKDQSPADVGAGQFKISDDSSVSSVWKMITESGYQPIMRDWIQF